ncbi:MAG: Mov34/MPN/PAD-1 family protein [Thermoplasmata archaeon]
MPEDVVAKMRLHARRTYPDECCGFLVAPADPAETDRPRTIRSAEPTTNDFAGVKRRRFIIRPEELLAAERALSGTELLVAGFYHSHPDHPARPSTFDQEHAWPWYTYLVLSVTATETPEIGAFELDAESGVFRAVPLVTTPNADARVTENLSARGGR